MVLSGKTVLKKDTLESYQTINEFLAVLSFDDLWRVMQTLGENLTKKDIEEMMREADQDGDGKINFAEFVEMIRFQDQSNQSNEENKVEQ